MDRTQVLKPSVYLVGFPIGVALLAANRNKDVTYAAFVATAVPSTIVAGVEVWERVRKSRAEQIKERAEGQRFGPFFIVVMVSAFLLCFQFLVALLQKHSTSVVGPAMEEHGLIHPPVPNLLQFLLSIPLVALLARVGFNRIKQRAGVWICIGLALALSYYVATHLFFHIFVDHESFRKFVDLYGTTQRLQLLGILGAYSVVALGTIAWASRHVPILGMQSLYERLSSADQEALLELLEVGSTPAAGATGGAVSDPQKGQACRSCGATLPEKAKFCNRCGTDVLDPEGPMICPRCASRNPPGSNFCISCGKKQRV